MSLELFLLKICKYLLFLFYFILFLKGNALSLSPKHYRRRRRRHRHYHLSLSPHAVHDRFLLLVIIKFKNEQRILFLLTLLIFSFI